MDECVFYFGRSVLLVYVDDSILMGPKEEELNYLITEMSKRLKLQEEGSVNEFLGLEIQREPQLIDSILSDLKLDGTNVKSRSTPVLKTRIL
jgi:hypothetical protein